MKAKHSIRIGTVLMAGGAIVLIGLTTGCHTENPIIVPPPPSLAGRFSGTVSNNMTVTYDMPSGPFSQSMSSSSNMEIQLNDFGRPAGLMLPVLARDGSVSVDASTDAFDIGVRQVNTTSITQEIAGIGTVRIITETNVTPREVSFGAGGFHIAYDYETTQVWEAAGTMYDGASARWFGEISYDSVLEGDVLSLHSESKIDFEQNYAGVVQKGRIEMISDGELARVADSQ